MLLLADPHTDFDFQRKAAFFSQPIPEVDAIVVAGDVGNDILQFDKFFSYFDGYKTEKYFVGGNHDFWANEARKEWGYKKSIYDIAQDHGFETPVESQTHRIVNGVLLFDLFYPADLSYKELYYTVDYDHMDVMRKFCRMPKVTSYEKVRFSVSHMSPSVRIPRLSWHKPSRMFINGDIDQVLRAHSSPVHLYGHTHHSTDDTIEGVRYINRTVGYDLGGRETYGSPPDHIRVDPKLESFIIDLPEIVKYSGE